MGCANCSTSDGNKPHGCNSNGGCTSGGCNRLNTYDWLAAMDFYDPQNFDLVEISFKNGVRKEFYHNLPHSRAVSGDMVVVDTGSGHNVGRINLSGELVKLQMKKKKVSLDGQFNKVIRKANQRDLERLNEARSLEKGTMIRSRVIARTLGLEMKVGEVEYQADKRKATFYYIAEGRVDFRELIRLYAKEFRVKIEMRQIGARQESALIGGIGSCGRELCCSTWLTDFKSVSTGAARYQNLAINQTKLSGQCGRLKCCLNYELETYMDAIAHFPKNVDLLRTEAGEARLIKTDIFKGLMFYAYKANNGRPGLGKLYPLGIDRVKEIKALNEKNEKPLELMNESALLGFGEKEIDFDEDLTGIIELPPEEKKKRRRNRNRNRGKKKGGGQRSNSNRGSGNKPKSQKSDKPAGDKRSGGKSRSRRRGSNRNRGGNKPGNKPGNKKD